MGCLTSRLYQYDGDELVAEIDAARPFEYRIIDQYDAMSALFRLYQGDERLSFYVSDPGGADAVRNVVQIPWPPRPQHAGRSYPPAGV